MGMHTLARLRLRSIPDRLRQRHRFAGSRIHPHHHYVAVAVKLAAVGGVDDAVRDRHGAVAQSRAVQLDVHLAGPFDRQAIVECASRHHRHGVFVRPRTRQLLQPLHARLFQIGEVGGVVDVIERIQIAPAHADRSGVQHRD